MCISEPTTRKTCDLHKAVDILILTFQVHHAEGADNVVADLYWMFEGRKVIDQEEGLLAMIQGLPCMPHWKNIKRKIPCVMIC